MLFNSILDKHAAIKRVKLRTRPSPFVTDEIKVLMRARDEWRRLAEKTNNSNAWSTYRLLKCEVRCELREAEKELLRNKKKKTLMIRAVYGKSFAHAFQRK